MSTNRSIGAYPVIGIKPTIGGKQGYMGVRESLEEQAMDMTKSAAALFRENLLHNNGELVNVAIADSTIGRMGESAVYAGKFRRTGVDITLIMTPCWCHGTKTMDMDPHTVKGVWGFNGTGRPGAVYLSSVSVTRVQKGSPVFGIYGHDAQDTDDISIPEDVKKKLLRFGRIAVVVTTMRGKPHLQTGSICMRIEGSIIDPAFIEEYLGMQVESVDEVGLIRRMSEEIYSKEESEKALTWTKANYKEGFDKNPPEVRRTREQKNGDQEFVVKMMCIIKDLMNGNPDLPEGREEERIGHNAIAASFQGQRQWTDFYPNGDFAESMPNSSFNWNDAREPYILAIENDTLNGLGTLSMKLLTNGAQIFTGVRAYWSPETVKKTIGYGSERIARGAGGFPHLISSGTTCLDVTDKILDEDGQLVMKLQYEVTANDQKAMMEVAT